MIGPAKGKGRQPNTVNVVKNESSETCFQGESGSEGAEINAAREQLDELRARLAEFENGAPQNVVSTSPRI